jgi:hypothetical protein
MAFPGFQWFGKGLWVGIALSLAAVVPAAAQGNDQKPAETAKPATEAAKPDAGTRRADDIAEASRIVIGPAGNPECVWLGRRVVSLLWNDDLDTAFRHLDLYDRFGCPAAHIQATFRCAIQQGNIDPKAQETLNTRVHSCWINPSMTPAPASAPAAQATPNGSSGTTMRSRHFNRQNI